MTLTFQLMLSTLDVSLGHPMSRGSQRDFLEREKEVLASRRGRLNPNEFKVYLPPTGNGTPEDRTVDLEIPEELKCEFRILSESVLKAEGLDAKKCLVINETCSEECSASFGAKIGAKNCQVVEDEVCEVVNGEDCQLVEDEICENTCSGQAGQVGQQVGQTGQVGQQAGQTGQVGQQVGQTELANQELTEVEDAIVKAIQQQLILVIKQEIEQGIMV